MYKVPFPLVIPIDEENKIYKGYINIQKQEHFIQVELGPRRQLLTTGKLNELIKDKQTLIETKLNEAQDIMTFLSEFKEILDEHDIGEKEKSFQPSADKLSFVYQELLSIGFEKVKYMNDTMDEIMFSIKDMSDREHELKVILPSNYPFTAPHIIADTPVPIQSSLSLTTIVRQHQTIIGQHQDLFNCLDDLDKHMRILEPEHPKRSELWRKIALSHHCSLYLEIVDPLLPFNKPQIRLFGSESRVENLRRVWDQAEWNKSLPLHTNLLTIFQLVPNDKQEQEDYTNASDIECAICYSYKLENGETPETICKLCNRGFHSTCLYQWLRSNPNTTQSFNVLFGHCPYCNEKITIKAII